MKKTFLAPYTLNIFRDCHRCFYLHMKYGIKRPKGPIPSIATGLDIIIKEYFDYYRKIGQLPPFLKDKIEGKLIEKLNKTYYWDINEEFKLYGMLDECIVDQEGRYIPLDHKTRSSSPKEVHEAYILQMEIYTLLLKNNGYKTTDFAYLVYYSPETSKIHNGITFNFDVKKIDIDISHAEKVVYDAINCLKNDLPKSNENCGYCKWVNDVKEFYINEGKIFVPKTINDESQIENEEFKDGKLFK